MGNPSKRPPNQPPNQPPSQPSTSLPPNPDQINRDLSLLHPVVRNGITEVLRQCENEQMPFKVFEAFRTPQRQAYLYAMGRSKPGHVVTQAKPFTSYHQFGLAADLVLFLDGKWDWDSIGTLGHCWERLTEIGQMYGLEGLSWEKPHLQLAGIEIGQLRAGSYPGGGDATWWDNLQKYVAKRTGT